MSSKPGIEDFFRSFAALIIASLVWPLLFIGTAILAPDLIDPLLGGIQYVLYVAAFLWLIFAFGVSAILSKLFRLKKSRSLFVIISIILSILIWAGFEAIDLYDRYHSIGRPGVVYPDSIDDVFNLKTLRSFAVSSAVIVGACFAVAAAFVLLGGLKGWISSSESK